MIKNIDRQALKIYSALFIFFALLDVVKAVFEAIDGAFSPENIAYAYNVTNEMATGVVIATITIMVIVFGAEMFLGLKGIISANSDSPTGRAHIVFAKVVMVLLVITLASQVYALFSNGVSNAKVSDWLDLITPIATVVIMFGYISSAKKVEAEKQ